MDKKILEKIIQILNEPLKVPWTGSATDTIRAGIEYQALEILQCLKELGYRKLPKDKPPLLSVEGLLEIEKAYNLTDKLSTYIETQDYEIDKAIAQAQREADIKHYEGE